MTDKSDYLPWIEGLPTRPDVDALIEAFPVAGFEIGFAISYAQVTHVIGSASNSNRFKTVTTAWRRRLQNDHHINLYCSKNTGFYVPATQEVLSNVRPRLRHIARTAKKHIREVRVARPENALERTHVEHQSNLMSAIARDAKKSRDNLLPSTASAIPPQIAAPRYARQRDAA